MMNGRIESYQRVSLAIQAVADWVDGNLGSFTWDINHRPTEAETESRRLEIQQANDTLRKLASEAENRHIDAAEFNYGIDRVNAAGFRGWHLDGRLVRAALQAINEQV